MDEIASEMELAPATIRRHLDILQRDALVTFEVMKKRTGRPEHLFLLTDAGLERLPKGYDRLLDLLLHEVKSFTPKDVSGLPGPKLLEKAFQAMAQRMLLKHADSLKGKSLEERAQVLAQMLEEQDFQPHVSLEGGRLKLQLQNCPYRSVAMSHPEVCQFDISLIGGMLGVQVSHLSCIARGDLSCLYTSTAPGKTT